MFASRRGRRHLCAIPLCRSPRPQRAVLVVVVGGGKDVTYAKRIDNPLQNSIRYPFVNLATYRMKLGTRRQRQRELTFAKGIASRPKPQGRLALPQRGRLDAGVRPFADSRFGVRVQLESIEVVEVLELGAQLGAVRATAAPRLRLSRETRVSSQTWGGGRRGAHGSDARGRPLPPRCPRRPGHQRWTWARL